MSYEYSEDNLIERTAIDLFFHELGWDTQLAYNKESFGEGSTLGRLNKKEVVLKKIFFDKLKEFNPHLPELAYKHAYEKLTEESITKTLAEINSKNTKCSAMAFRLILSTKKVSPLKIKY